MEEAEKMTCYKRLIYKQFVQVSGLCGPQFLSYLPKRFTHPCRALYGDAILVYRFGPPIWPPEINKTSGVHFFYKSSFFSLENQPTCAKTYLVILEMVMLLKIKRRDFFQRDSIPVLVSRTVKTRKFVLLYFRNETCYGNGNLNKDLFFVYLQPSLNKNS